MTARASISSKGFTLIEVLICLAMMAAIDRVVSRIKLNTLINMKPVE